MAGGPRRLRALASGGRGAWREAHGHVSEPRDRGAGILYPAPFHPLLEVRIPSNRGRPAGKMQGMEGGTGELSLQLRSPPTLPPTSRVDLLGSSPASARRRGLEGGTGELKNRGISGPVMRLRVSVAWMLQRARPGARYTRSGMGLPQWWQRWSRRKASVPVISRHSLQPCGSG
jgi:hypothetical protein